MLNPLNFFRKKGKVYERKNVYSGDGKYQRKENYFYENCLMLKVKYKYFNPK
jgi:hypothetical protein